MNENEYPSNASNGVVDSRYVNSNTNYQYENLNTEQNANGYRGMYSNSYPNDFGQQPKVPKKKEPKKKNPFLRKAAACIVLGIFFGFFTGVSFYAVKSVNDYMESKNTVTASTGAVAGAGQAAEKTSVEDTVAAKNEVTAVVTDVTKVVESVMPSVVSITNMYTAKENYFGQEMQSQQEAGGSGIIIGENENELLVATNYHVVESADELHVKFIDGSESTAQVKGTNSGMDLAVVAVQLSTLSAETKANITIAKLGDSDSLKVGEPAIAIGNALGYGQSVTTGVISALNRSIATETSQTQDSGIGSESISSLIQTDAAINPGNSGGALLNMQGEVIGINSNKIGGTVIEGMGYAIPISTAQPIIEDLMTKTTRLKVNEEEAGYLGISGVAVTEEVVATYGMPKGVLIAQVYDGTGAANAGLIKGDIITKFDGSSVDSMEGLQKMLQYYSAGSEVEVTISQGSPKGWQEKIVKLVLSPKPAEVLNK